MTTMTSGYRARHGLPNANHDPEPWVRADFTRAADLDDALEGLDGPPILAPLNRPRAEFNVSENLVLADFRSLADMVLSVGGSYAIDAGAWVGLIDEDPDMVDPLNWGSMAGVPTHDEIDHARRVLHKLAALGADND